MPDMQEGVVRFVGGRDVQQEVFDAWDEEGEEAWGAED